MDVILLERIESLGQMGDVVSVKPGFARNYLLPRHKAMRATEENRSIFEQKRSQLEAVNLERRAEAESVAEQAKDVTVILIRQAGEAGQLYGSVSAKDVAAAVTEAGVTVARSQVRLERPIKALGLHRVRVGLHPEVAITVTVNVARSEEESQVQAATGQAVVHRDEEDDLEQGAAAPEDAARETAESAVEAPTKMEKPGEEENPCP